MYYRFLTLVSFLFGRNYYDCSVFALGLFSHKNISKLILLSLQVGVTCLSFPIHDVNNFLVGSDEGAAYTGCRHGSKAGIIDAYEG